MRSPQLVVLAILLSALVVPRADAGCAHLLGDPTGDVAPVPTGAGFPAPADDAQQVDLQWAELHSTQRTLVATLKVADLNPESQPLADHGYEVAFNSGGQRYDLVATVNHYNSWAAVWHELTPNAAEGIGSATGVLDARHDTITITADLSVFATRTPLSGSLTAVTAQTWTGVNAPAVAAFPFADDDGKTSNSYRLGAASCS